ncbi:DUF6892 domain-containing protein [Microbacterium gorillae]|uniref:DUF6892 domain-containing protein n=1 Tax=Microbacterium gorillae TaxID=1231063 RepID=UPI00058E9D5A|nr:hypothetical protein [Microbacterium gorillae]
MGLRDLFRRDPSRVPTPSPGPPPSQPTGGVRFRSFPLKLAVLQRLMYDEGAVLPAFTMPPALHPGAAVTDWFRGFPIPEEHAAVVTDLRFSRAAEVYRQLDPTADATDGRYDLTALPAADLEALPALRRVTDPDGMIAEPVRDLLRARGIVVD